MIGGEFFPWSDSLNLKSWWDLGHESIALGIKVHDTQEDFITGREKLAIDLSSSDDVNISF